MVEVRRVEPRSPRLLRVTLGGDELAGFAVEQPAASVRLLLPPNGTGDLVLPEWTGNEFRLPDGRRPTIRTLTPRHFDAAAGELAVEIVVHDQGVAARWASTVAPGERVAVSGPGRGYPVPADAEAFLLAGDETAIPAISQLLEVLPRDVPVEVHVETARPDGRLPLPDHPRAAVTWHDLPAGSAPGSTLVGAMREAPISAGTKVWAAGEAAAMQRIRRHLFEERGVPRAATWIRGYWKQGVAGEAGEG